MVSLIRDMPFDQYLADPCPEPSLTSSLVRRLLSTAPRRVWHETKRLNPDAPSNDREIFDIGTVAHALFTGEGNEVEVIEAADWRTKAAQEARDAARADGKTPILRKHKDAVDVMAAEAHAQFGANPDIGPLLKDALREATITWTELGVMHRARPDFYHVEANAIIHYKTTGVEIGPASAAKYAAGAGWDMIAAHYEAAGVAAAGSPPRQFFAVQETAAPHLCLVTELDATFLAEARARRKRAIEIWAKCLRTGNWPGNINRTIKLECPEWHERNMIAQKDAEEAAKLAGSDLYDLGLHWQAPEGYEVTE